MDDILERIKLILEKEGISPSELADTIGIGRPLLSHIFSGRNNPSLQVVLKILESYPAYSANWLLTGVENEVDVGLDVESQKIDSTLKAVTPELFEDQSLKRIISEPEEKTNQVKLSDQAEMVLMMFEDKTYEAYKLRK